MGKKHAILNVGRLDAGRVLCTAVQNMNPGSDFFMAHPTEFVSSLSGLACPVIQGKGILSRMQCSFIIRAVKGGKYEKFSVVEPANVKNRLWGLKSLMIRITASPDGNRFFAGQPSGFAFFESKEKTVALLVLALRQKEC